MIILGFRGVNCFGLHGFSCFYISIYQSTGQVQHVVFVKWSSGNIYNGSSVTFLPAEQVFNGFPFHKLFIDVSRKHMKLKM